MLDILAVEDAMLEALWSVEFVSNLGGLGAGVVVLETGRIFGGDSSYYYTGNYEFDRDNLRAEIDVTHYAGEPSSVFGPVPRFRLNATGEPRRDVFEIIGHRVDAPNQQIRIRLTRRAELP